MDEDRMCLRRSPIGILLAGAGYSPRQFAMDPFFSTAELFISACQCALQDVRFLDPRWF